jgi:putative endonuclease
VNPRERGRQLENVARKFLEDEGLTLVHHNYSCKLGEIDLVMHDGDTLVFVEVRGRRSQRFGNPAETVTAAKQNRLIRTAQVFLCAHPRYLDWPCRFDVLALATADPAPQAQWIQNAFDAN